MRKKNVEIVLLKQLASCLAMPMMVIGPDGDLLYFNESSESLMGRRFDETGELDRDEWPALYQTSDDYGVPIKREERPMIGALERREIIHSRFWLHGLDGHRRKIEGTAVPLVDEDDEFLGVLGLFWELSIPHMITPGPSAPQLKTRQHPVEMILARRLASTLAAPIFLVDEQGRVLYFNAGASRILGRDFADLGGVSRGDLYASFKPRNENGIPIVPNKHPLSIARLENRPAHSRSWIHGLDGSRRLIEVTAIPLIGQAGRALGAFGVFWEIDEK
jgi:PAS domain-containing protein